MRDGTLKGILWHQGESDSGAEQTAMSYAARLTKMVGNLRSQLGTGSAPFVAGELGRFLKAETREGTPSYWKVVNEQLHTLPTSLPAAAVVSSDGLSHKGDDVHFDTASLREFGRRYAAQMEALQSQKTESGQAPQER
jgi:hypothetical protein